MKLICVVKYVPDVDSMSYDYEKNTLIREGVRQILNPDDVCGIGCALEIKKNFPETVIQVVTMAPKSIMPHLEDLVRIGVDRCVLLSDQKFSGSDTYATSLVLAKYVSSIEYDCIFTGNHGIDGDTSHVPAQIAERLNLNQLSHISKVDTSTFSSQASTVVVEYDSAIRTFEVGLPAVLSLTRESNYKLPFVKRSDMYKDVKDAIQILDHHDLDLSDQSLGIDGSLTRVVKTYTKNFETKDHPIINVDDEGIEIVFNFLKDKGLLK